MTRSKPVRARAPCNSCTRSTNHRVLSERERVYHDPDEPFWTRHLAQLLECEGCDSVSLRVVDTCSETEDAEVHYYPPPTSRRMPEWAEEHLPRRVGSLLSETYTALHANSLALALMGARALLDMAIVKQVKDVGSFEQKLERLEQEGFVARRSRDVLKAALDAGSAAAHRGFAPSAETANRVIDIVEHVLESVFVLGSVAKEVRAITPKRPRRRKKRTSSAPPLKRGVE